MRVQPYLFFNGRCEEAIHYDAQHLGATIDAAMRYKQAPPGDGPGANANANGEHIMFSCISIGDTVVMAMAAACRCRSARHASALFRQAGRSVRRALDGDGSATVLRRPPCVSCC